MIQDSDMSDFVLSAEDVTHTNLTKKLFNKKKLFGPIETYEFVITISTQFYNILNRTDEENQ